MRCDTEDYDMDVGLELLRDTSQHMNVLTEDRKDYRQHNVPSIIIEDTPTSSLEVRLVMR